MKSSSLWVEFPRGGGGDRDGGGVASSSPPSCSSWETFDDVNFNDDDDDARTRRRLRRPSLAAAQPSRNDRNRTTEDNKAAASAINHPISEDVAFARMNKPNDFRLRNLFFQQDVSVYSSVTETVRIRANTFNANGKKPNEKLDIRDWLMNDKGDDDAVVDVYAVGFQEIVPLQVQKVLKVQDVERDARMWDEKILRCLNSVSARNGVGGGYVKITSVQLVGVYLRYLFARS
jgi:hypothetical protein